MDLEITELITDLTSDDRTVRWRAESKLMSLRAREAVPVLVTALDDPHAHVRVVVARTLGELRKTAAVPALIAALQRREYGSAADNAGAAIAEALGTIGDPRAVDALIGALDHPLTEIAAIYALGRIGDPRATEPLIAALRRTHNPSIPSVLARIGDARAVWPLIEELRAIQQPSPSQGAESRWRGIYFFYVARALGKLGDRQALPILEWVREHETAPILKGKSVGYAAARAIDRLMSQSTRNE